MPDPKPDARTIRALQGVARSLSRLGRERARAAGADLTPQQAESLQLLAERGVISTSALALMLGIDPSTASRNLAGLERRGYIVRRRGAEDGRQTDVRLTPAESEPPKRCRPGGAPWWLRCSSAFPGPRGRASQTRSIRSPASSTAAATGRRAVSRPSPDRPPSRRASPRSAARRTSRRPPCAASRASRGLLFGPPPAPPRS